MRRRLPRRSCPPAPVFDGLCDDYLATSDFDRLAPKTQALNRLHVEKLRGRFSGLLVRGIIKSAVEAFRETLDREIKAAAKLPRPALKPNYGRANPANNAGNREAPDQQVG